MRHDIKKKTDEEKQVDIGFRSTEGQRHRIKTAALITRKSMKEVMEISFELFVKEYRLKL